MFKKSRGSINTSIIIGVTVIVLTSLVWIVYTDQQTTTSLEVRELVQNKTNEQNKNRTLVNVSDPYDVEKRLANASVYTTDTAIKQEVTYLVQDLKEEVQGMYAQAAVLESETNYQKLTAENDQILDEIAKETGQTKEALLQEVENDMFAPVSMPASIELEQEIVITEQKKEELANRFKAFANKTD